MILLTAEEERDCRAWIMANPWAGPAGTCACCGAPLDASALPVVGGGLVCGAGLDCMAGYMDLREAEARAAMGLRERPDPERLEVGQVWRTSLGTVRTITALGEANGVAVVDLEERTGKDASRPRRLTRDGFARLMRLATGELLEEPLAVAPARRRRA